VPLPFGEHLTWLWARMREQRFFFPWYETNDAHRMRLPEAAAEHLHANVMDMLYAGDSYRAGYGAVVRANRALPDDDRAVPTLIVSFDGDPLQTHLGRLGQLPHNWQVQSAETQGDTEVVAKQFLDKHPSPAVQLSILPDTSRKFVRDVHVLQRGLPSALLLHGPGSSGESFLEHHCGEDALAMDLPGHGLTSAEYVSLEHSADLVRDLLAQIDFRPRVIIAENLAMPLAMMLIRKLGLPDIGLQVLHYRNYSINQIEALRKYYLTDIAPDKYGNYLLAAWRRVRDSCFFDPWFANEPLGVKPVDEHALALPKLAIAHCAALQATGGHAYLQDVLDIFEKEKADGNT
jgi:haloalkane dehalogenase